MESRLEDRRLWLATSLAIALALAMGPMLSVTPALATHVDPDPVDRNANCEGLDGIEELHREEDPTDGSEDVVIGGVTYTISWDVHADNTFDWWTTNGLLIQAVFAKGGPGGGGNLYDYRPLGGETADDGLHALEAGDGFAELSHITFCGDVENPTTTTAAEEETTTTAAEEETTTTAAEEETTTTAEVSDEEETTTTTEPAEETTTTAEVSDEEETTTTTEPAEETTTTAEVLGTVVTSTTVEDEAQVSPSTLPFTGVESEHLALLAMTLLAGGALVLVGARSVRNRHES